MKGDIYLKSASDREFFLIHGYTGGPTDFNELPFKLHKAFDANVRVIVLKGHCTCIEDLDQLHYHDFLKQVEAALKEDMKRGRKIVIGGVSFGAMMAAHLAGKYPLEGLLLISPPYGFKAPFSIPFVQKIGKIKKYWKKPLSKGERKLRKNAHYYTHMHINGLEVTKTAKRHAHGLLENMTMPVLIIHSKHDPIGSLRGAKKLAKRIPSKNKKSIVFTNKNHNIFFSESRDYLYAQVISFFRYVFERKGTAAERKKRYTVAAIIPAYNEEKKIKEVLEAVTKAESVDKVVVVDDGSTDRTAEIAKGFRKVLFLRNEKNMGKSYSMQRGVDATDADILFFCDADLEGLTPDIIGRIIQPVRERKVDMFIGLRNNLMQKAVHLFALNSGERAVRRDIWERLPHQFKYRFRIEAGLNYAARKYGKGYGSATFDYYQTVKEKKYGWWRGTLLRWWMNFDVGVAYAMVLMSDIKSMFKRLLAG